MSQYFDFRKEIDYTKLKEVATGLNNGKIVVFPTDTVYGIGTSALNSNAIKRLYEIKHRPLDKPLSVLVSNINMIEQIAEDISKLEYALIKNFFPGPLTLILKKKNIIPNIVTSNKDTIGVRMPENEIALKLIDYSNAPIATPSANITGKPSGTCMEDIIKEFDDTVDYFIDSGKSKIGISSTVVQIIDNVPHILRQGSITEEQINKVIKCSKN